MTDAASVDKVEEDIDLELPLVRLQTHPHKCAHTLVKHGYIHRHTTCLKMEKRKKNS